MPPEESRYPRDWLKIGKKDWRRMGQAPDLTREGTATVLRDKVKEIRRIARAYGVVRLRVFGSRALGTATAASDLDVLVDLKPRRDLLDLVGFKLDLEDLLGCEVDVLTEGSLSPYLRSRILRQAKPLCKDKSVYLKHIRDAIVRIEWYTARS